MTKVTIIDVAKHAGVSKSTVSRVIRGEYQTVKPATRDRVIQSINELGYEKNAIAGSLRTNETKMIWRLTGIPWFFPAVIGKETKSKDCLCRREMDYLTVLSSTLLQSVKRSLKTVIFRRLSWGIMNSSQNLTWSVMIRQR